MKTAIEPIHRPYNFQDGRQFSQALFTKVEHSDRSDEGLGSRLGTTLTFYVGVQQTRLDHRATDNQFNMLVICDRVLLWHLDATKPVGDLD